MAYHIDNPPDIVDSSQSSLQIVLELGGEEAKLILENEKEIDQNNYPTIDETYPDIDNSRLAIYMNTMGQKLDKILMKKF